MKAISIVWIFGLLVGIESNAFKAEPDSAQSQSQSQIQSSVASSGLTTEILSEVEFDRPLADGTTALHLAVLNNDTKSALELIRAGIEVDQENDYGITPLWLACRNGNSEIVEALLRSGADPKRRFSGNQTALMAAARAGSLDSVKSLAKSGVDIDAKEGRGQTAMMWAAAEGHAEVVDWLIQAGADFQAPLKGGFTPLFFAIREGNSDVVKVILSAGADVNEVMLPERRAGRGPQSGMTPLVLAVENGHFELAIDLVKAGADPNDLSPGYAALHAISWVRKPDHGEGVDGMPPPDGSGSITSTEFIRKIVELGADVNLQIERGSGGAGRLNLKGATPFLMAAKTADLESLKLLLELGADPLIRTVDEVTPVIAAAGLGTLAAGEVAGTEPEVLETLKWLLEIGLDVNAVSKQGETAMHAAAYKNLPKVIGFLADAGADVKIWNQPNQHGWTPLLIAEGFRPGNFKPSFETIDAIHQELLKKGITPPSLTSAEGVNNSDFGPASRKYIPKVDWKKDERP